MVLFTNLHGSNLLQCVAGFPVYPAGQLHTGNPLLASQCALVPQAPSQGFKHLEFLQTKLAGHSASDRHSTLLQNVIGSPL